jgi:hypothetical protein
VIHAHDIHRGVVLGGRAHDNFFATDVDMRLCLLLSEVGPWAVGNVLCPCVSPIEGLGLFVIEDFDFVAIDWDLIVACLLDVRVEST